MYDGDSINISYKVYVGEERELVLFGDRNLTIGFTCKIREISDILNKSFREAVIGKDYEIRIEPAFTKRNVWNIELHTLYELEKENINPEVGLEITLKGRTGKVMSLTARRVVIDFNPKWAGKVVYFNYRINSALVGGKPAFNIDLEQRIFTYDADTKKYGYIWKKGDFKDSDNIKP